MKKSKLVKASVTGLIAVAAVAVATDEAHAKKGMEKCFGVVKAGMNGCATSKHSCMSMAKTDGDASEWIYLPKGTCDKLAGGKVGKGKMGKM